MQLMLDGDSLRGETNQIRLESSGLNHFSQCQDIVWFAVERETNG